MIDVKYALEVLQVQMEVGYRVAHETHHDLRNVHEEIVTKLSFLFEIDALTKEQYFPMLNYAERVYKEELRKEKENESSKNCS